MKYFAFDHLKQMQYDIESYVIFVIVCFVVYLWVKMFLYFDGR